MTSGQDNADIVARLRDLQQQWCADTDQDDENQQSDGGDDSTKKEQQPQATPLDVAKDIISNAEPLSDDTTNAIFASLLSTLRTALETEQSSNAVKLKQIQWHVIMIFELWGKMTIATGDNDNNTAWLEKCATVLEGDLGSAKKSKRRKSKKGSSRKHRKQKSPSAKTTLLHHLVDTLSRAPYLLPFGTPLGAFLSDIITQQHWEAIPDTVTHLYEAFEIPNPFLETESTSDVEYGFGFLSIAAGAPLLEAMDATDTANDDATTERADVAKTAKTSTPATNNTNQKRRRGKSGVVQKQQKKQRVLSNLKQNRFKSITNKRTTHFHGKFSDISKLLDKASSTPSSSGSTAATQHGKKKRPSTTSDETRKKTKKVPVITPHHSKVPSAKATKSSIKKVPSIDADKSKRVTIRESNRNDSNNDSQDMLMSPPASHTVQVASTPPTEKAGLTLNLPQNLQNETVGETPTKLKTRTQQPPPEQVVGETPALKRSRSLVQEIPASMGLLDNLDVADSTAEALSTTTQPAAVQPVKLFGTLRPNKAKPLAGGGGGGKKTTSVSTEKKKSSGIKSIQMARALLRRKSI